MNWYTFRLEQKCTPKPDGSIMVDRILNYHQQINTSKRSPPAYSGVKTDRRELKIFSKIKNTYCTWSSLFTHGIIRSSLGSLLVGKVPQHQQVQSIPRSNSHISFSLLETSTYCSVMCCFYQPLDLQNIHHNQGRNDFVFGWISSCCNLLVPLSTDYNMNGEKKKSAFRDNNNLIERRARRQEIRQSWKTWRRALLVCRRMVHAPNESRDQQQYPCPIIGTGRV